jgi:hypothetical protein
MSIFDAVDQRVRDAGFNFVPFNRFLASPFQIPTDSPDSSDAAAAGIPAVYQPRPQDRQGGGTYAASLGLGPDTRGFIGNFQDINPNEMYSYTPQGITIEDLSKPSNIGDFQVTTAPDLPNQSGYIKPAPEIFEPQQQNMFQKTLGTGFDLAKTVGSGILSAATGIPFLGPALEGFAGQFENRPLGAAVIDEFGNVYSEDELNKQNALGGFYTNAARSARRRTRRIQNMLQRQALGKKISLANLRRLQAQEKKQEEIRQAAAKALQDENRDRGRGGYQAGYDSDFMEGPGGGRDADQEASSPGSSGPGGSDSMGSFMDGGIVDLVDIYD